MRAALLSGVAIVALAEVACRIDAFFPRAPFDSRKAREHFELRSQAGADQTLALYTAPDPAGAESSVRPIPHPFLGWTCERDVRTLEEQDRWFSSGEAQRSFDVFVLGGSVAAEFGNRAAEAIATALAADPRLGGRPVRVWNQAHAGFKAPQTANLLAWLALLGQHPDAVVLVDGFNEVAIARTNAAAGVHPAMPSHEFWAGIARGKAADATVLDRLVELHEAQRAEQAVARTAVEWGFYRSALLTRITLGRLSSRHRAFQSAVERYLAAQDQKDGDPAVRGTAFDPAPEAVAALSVRAWRENARSIAAHCRSRGALFVHVLQPTVYDAGSKPLTGEEARQTEQSSLWMEGARLCYPLLRASGAELARTGHPFVDATRVFEHEERRTYVDMCHLNELGNELLAALVARELLARLP